MSTETKPRKRQKLVLITKHISKKQFNALTTLVEDTGITFAEHLRSAITMYLDNLRKMK